MSKKQIHPLMIFQFHHLVKHSAMADDAADNEAPVKVLDEDDIVFLKHYGMGPYAGAIRQTENDVKEILTRVNGLTGVKESDTGLAPPSRWDLASDKQMMQEEQPLQVIL